jgi:hypothetical protein
VYGLGRAEDGKTYRDIHMVSEGLKTYPTAAGSTKTVKAFTRVELTDKDCAKLRRAREALAAAQAQYAAKLKTFPKNQGRTNSVSKVAK